MVLAPSKTSDTTGVGNDVDGKSTEASLDVAGIKTGSYKESYILLKFPDEFCVNTLK